MDTGGIVPDDEAIIPANIFKQAQAAIDEADRNPKDFTAQIRAAAIFFQLGSMDKAELYLNRSLALKPDDPDALTGMGQTKYEAGDYAGASDTSGDFITEFLEMSGDLGCRLNFVQG